MGDKIRLLATGDFHSDKKLVDEIRNFKELNSIDHILFIGDLSNKCDDFGDLFGIFKGKQIFMVPGNHEGREDIRKLEEHYGVHFVGNAPVELSEDFALFGSNYVPIGPYGLCEEDILDNLHDNFEAVKTRKVKLLMHHMPPSKCKIGDMSPFEFIGGSCAVRKFLEKESPDFAICGHIHESSGLEEKINKTNVLNVGRTFRVFEFNKKKKELKVIK